MKKYLSLALAALLTAPAAAITIDGTVDAGYGAPLAVQTVQTGFGDEDGLTDPNGGELDAAYLAIDAGRLYIAITGNLETDSFNKLNLFIDSRAGGESTLAVQNYDFTDVARNLGAISFQAGFEPDFHLYARAGGGNFFVDLVDRQNGAGTDVLASTGMSALSGDYGTAVGATTGAATDGTGVVGPAVASPVEYALDNSNTAGVIGGSAAADQVAAAAVTTGAEFSIALSDLGVSPGDTISVLAGYSNGDYNFWSNQFLGGLAAPQANLGADGAGNFIADASTTALDLSGSTPFSITVPVIPEPTTAALLALVAAGCLATRR